jgi:hypothetical protein
MKPQIQYECMDESCNSFIVATKSYDGLNCPKCRGPVLARPYEPKLKISKRVLFVRSDIVRRNLEHCFDLTPEQIETVLDIGERYIQTMNNFPAVGRL